MPRQSIEHFTIGVYSNVQLIGYITLHIVSAGQCNLAGPRGTRSCVLGQDIRCNIRVLR